MSRSSSSSSVDEVELFEEEIGRVAERALREENVHWLLQLHLTLCFRVEELRDWCESHATTKPRGNSVADHPEDEKLENYLFDMLNEIDEGRRNCMKLLRRRTKGLRRYVQLKIRSLLASNGGGELEAPLTWYTRPDWAEAHNDFCDEMRTARHMAGQATVALLHVLRRRRDMPRDIQLMLVRGNVWSTRWDTDVWFTTQYT